MKVVIPISSADAHLLEDFVTLFRALGGAPRQDIILLPTRSLSSKAKIAAEAMQSRARSVTVIEWEKDNVERWPFAGNFMWQHAVMEMGKQEEAGNAQPWYFMELDNTMMPPTPERPGNCFDALESEHAMSGCLYTGAVVPTRIIVDGKYTTEENIPGQVKNIPHMVGTGIYPPNVAKHTEGQWFYAKFESWDVFLRFYMSRSLHATKLIQHRWSTINYRRVGDKITCDNGPENSFGTDHSGEVDPGAAIVHGCKDGSLAKLILESLKLAPIEPPPIQSTEIKSIPAQTPIHASVEYDNAGWTALQQNRAESTLAPPAPTHIAAIKSGVPTMEPIQKEDDQEQSIAELPEPPGPSEEFEKLVLETIDKKNYRLKDLAVELGVLPEVIRELSGVEVLSPSQWVKPKQGIKPKKINFKKSLEPA